VADSALLAAGGADAPLSYLVPGTTAIRIKQIHVSYADNGASGDWLPAVRIISDSKHRMGTAADQAVKVTAGSDADVSFFPGVKHAAAAGGGSFHWCMVTLGADVPSGSLTPGPGTVMTIADFQTNDSANYVQVDGQHWQIAGVPTILNYQLTPGPGGAPFTTNGDVAGVIKSGAGGASVVFNPNAVEVFATSGARMLTSSFEWTNNFRCELRGSDTHSWFVLAYFGAFF
jgi:hypothetical protein